MQSGEDVMTDRYTVISADGHAGPPASVYRDYLDPGFRDRFDDHQRAAEEPRASFPSEYLDRNCYFGASTPGQDDIDRRHLIGVGNIMWGNDLPHPEGTYPHTRYWIRERFRDVATDETRQMLGSTAAAVYGLDLDALAPLADKIGPTVADVHGEAPPADLPAPATATV
jgi:hypothetical protein